MDKKQYKEFYQRAIKNISQDYYYPYALFKKHLREFRDFKKNKVLKLEIHSELVEMCELHSLKRGLFSFSINKENLIFKSFMTIIANNILAVLNLLMAGLEYQALVVLRNLYEVSHTFLTIIIDETKKIEYMESAAKNNEYHVWKKHFTHRKLVETLSAYEKKISPDGDLDFLNTWRSSIYSKYSGIAHNDLFNVVSYSFAIPETANEEEVLESSIWGGVLSRTNQIMIEMADLLFYVDVVFQKLLEDPAIGFKKEYIVHDEDNSRDYWNYASELMLIIREYYFEIKIKIEQDNAQ